MGNLRDAYYDEQRFRSKDIGYDWANNSVQISFFNSNNNWITIFYSYDDHSDYHQQYKNKRNGDRRMRSAKSSTTYQSMHEYLNGYISDNECPPSDLEFDCNYAYDIDFDLDDDDDDSIFSLPSGYFRKLDESIRHMMGCRRKQTNRQRINPLHTNQPRTIRKQNIINTVLHQHDKDLQSEMSQDLNIKDADTHIAINNVNALNSKQQQSKNTFNIVMDVDDNKDDSEDEDEYRDCDIEVDGGKTYLLPPYVCLQMSF